MKQKLMPLFLALFTFVGMWAQTYTVTYNKGAGGTFYNQSNAAVTSGWSADKWVSTGEGPTVTITSNTTNNNSFQAEYGHISFDRTFTISVTGNYLITGYKITVGGAWDSKATVTPVEGGSAVTFNSTADVLDVTDLNTKSTFFTNATGNLVQPTIAIYLDNLPDYTDQVTANIQPFVDYPGTGLFRMSAEDAVTLGGEITTAQEDGVISLAEYNELQEDFENYVNFPETGYYLIKNVSSGEYLAYGVPVEWGKVNGLVVTAEITPANIIRLTNVGLNKYTISSQGLNVQTQTTGNINFPMTSAAGAHFSFTPATADNLIITNAESYVDETHPGTLFDPKWNKPSGVVNWQAYGEPGRWTIEAVSSFNLTIGSTGYSTLWVPFAVTIPTGVEAYTGSINGDYLHLNEITGGVIPANTAVILKGSADTYTFDITNNVTGIDGNALLGSKGDVSGGSSIYALAQKGDPAVIGFYPVSNSIKVPANKAYLNISSGVKGFVFEFEDEATSINEELKMKEEASEPSIFNLVGQRIQKMQRGINIVNGKKVLY